jgi:Ras-related protein Rab-1A
MNFEYDYLFKILLIGDSGVGKTAILSKFVDDQFIDNYISTIGVDFRIKTIDLDNKIIKLQIWDTAGQERFRTITSTYYRGARGIFIVFDLTNLDSYLNISKWLDEINKYSINCCIYIVGTKKDLYDKRVITPNMINLIKQQYNYIEVSALNGHNISQAFHELAYQIKNLNTLNIKINKPTNINLNNIKPIKSSNCC